MVTLLQHVFTILHIIAAAAWFGMGLRLAIQARSVNSLEREAALVLADDARRAIRFMGFFIVLTLVFAFVTFVLGSRTARYGGEFHAAMLLIVVLVALQYGLIQPGWKKLRDAIAQGDDAKGYQKQVAIGIGIGHLIWFVLLVLMFWEKLRTAL
ncbi:MAG: hypothetical protein ACE5G0_20790 [Rhodothermales bacterium]